ncbi:jg746 [Pararge aegeria aegeria]|uniref:Jg746 protein n=1 Tax=Pararge aegeria aegeria TaxID=348720 RepID=A0A8S4S325_9NEOP|nr:jg746 [Pararge aegeria aegeria]
MAARSFAFIALCACAITTSRAVEPSARIYISSRTRARPASVFASDDVEKRYTPEIAEELKATKENALLLYTEYTSAASTDMKAFIHNVSSLLQDTIRTMESRVLDRALKSTKPTYLHWSGVVGPKSETPRRSLAEL